MAAEKWTIIRDEPNHKERLSPTGIRIVERKPGNKWIVTRTYPDGRTFTATGPYRKEATKETQRRANESERGDQ